MGTKFLAFVAKMSEEGGGGVGGSDATVSATLRALQLA